jgi:hypothetical protein
MGPVQVLFEAAAGKATVRYAGMLASNTDRVVARVGCEWFNSPRWQLLTDVEMKRVTQGVFEAQLPLPLKGPRGGDLMALQVAFQAPNTRSWDSAGVPYGYYQVSAVTGSVEPASSKPFD